MNRLSCALFFFLAAFSSNLNADISRDIQHEIDEINILICQKNITKSERDFLFGKSVGLFIALEIVIHNEQVKKPPRNGKTNRGKYFDFFPDHRRLSKIFQ